MSGIEKLPDPGGTAKVRGRLERTALVTSRLLDFATRKELTAQTGHEPDAWPAVIAKELIDNAIDACEEAGIAPEITVTVDETGITVGRQRPRPAG